MLISTMLANTEGVKFLSEDRLLWQLADCFTNIDEVGSTIACPSRLQTQSFRLTCNLPPQRSKRTTSAAILSKDRIDKTLTHGYFEMLGVLSKHREGMQ